MKPYVATSELTREEWLAKRQQLGVGASEVAVLHGLNPFKTALDLWNEKISDTIVEQELTPAMEFGSKLEQIIADTYVERSGRKVIRDNKIRMNPDFPYMFCSLDRVILSSDDGRGPGILECKTTSSKALKHWAEGIPLWVWSQVQAQLGITGYQWAVIALLVDGRDYKEFEVLPDLEFIAAQSTIVKAFWLDNVLAKIPPEPVVRDLEQIASKPGTVLEGNPAVFEAYERLLDLRAEKAKLEEQASICEDVIKAYLGDKELLTRDGATIATWKTTKRKEYVVKAGEYRQFRIKSKEENKP